MEHKVEHKGVSVIYVLNGVHESMARKSAVGWDGA
jgi:hypothetical protein